MRYSVRFFAFNREGIDNGMAGSDKGSQTKILFSQNKIFSPFGILKWLQHQTILFYAISDITFYDMLFLWHFVFPMLHYILSGNCTELRFADFLSGGFFYCFNNKSTRNTMRKNLPKTLDQLIFCKYTLLSIKCSQI